MATLAALVVRLPHPTAALYRQVCRSSQGINGSNNDCTNNTSHDDIEYIINDLDFNHCAISAAQLKNSRAQENRDPAKVACKSAGPQPKQNVIIT